MSKKAKRGDRESTWQVARRCLALLRRVQQGPVKKEGLLAAVLESEGVDAYGGSEGENLAGKLEKDKVRLREKLGVEIRYSADEGGYVIASAGRPLLALGDEHLQTLAFLADTFEPDSPHGREVLALINTLLGWMDEERQQAYKEMRGLLPDVDLRLRDNEQIAADVWERVLEAYNVRQQIRFDYLSSRHQDGVKREHIVEPWHVYFSERGHYRLDGYCLFNDGPNGPWYPERFFNYRLSRIVPGSVEILSRRLPPTRTPRPYRVVYELSPKIARFGVSPRPELLEPPVITKQENGWKRVEGRTCDVFHLARNLLYYGGHCQVLGGPELRAEVEKLVGRLGNMYGKSNEER